MKGTLIAIIVFLGVFLIASPAAYAAESTFFAPIVPTECQSCPCGYAGVLEIIRHLTNFAVSFGVIVVTIMLAWGGFMYIVSVANPENRRQANSLISGAVIGLLLVLGSWLIIDFIMRAAYSGPDGTEGKFGPWNSILAESADFCIVAKQTKPLFSGLDFSGPSTNPTDADPNTNPGDSSMPVDPKADGKFSYQGGISAQAGHAAPVLNSLLSCMAARVPANVGQISSISDSRIANGDKTFAQCNQGGCAHSAGSCHYGGNQCTGKSYAVDFGDEVNKVVLMKAARACGANFVKDEGDHVHVSVGASCSCN